MKKKQNKNQSTYKRTPPTKSKKSKITKIMATLCLLVIGTGIGCGVYYGVDYLIDNQNQKVYEDTILSKEQQLSELSKQLQDLISSNNASQKEIEELKAKIAELQVKQINLSNDYVVTQEELSKLIPNICESKSLNSKLSIFFVDKNSKNIVAVANTDSILTYKTEDKGNYDYNYLVNIDKLLLDASLDYNLSVINLSIVDENADCYMDIYYQYGYYNAVGLDNNYLSIIFKKHTNEINLDLISDINIVIEVESIAE